MYTVELVQSVVIQVKISSTFNILVKILQIFLLAALVNWSVIYLLNSVDRYYSSDRCIKTKTVRKVFSEHVHLYSLVPCDFEGIRFQDFFNRLDLFNYFVDLISSVNASAEIKWVIPIKFSFRSAVLQKLDSRYFLGRF